MNKTLFAVGIAGVLFSGYLSTIKFIKDTCAFNETCPYFLGYPACYFGFAMFLGIAIVSATLVFSKIERKQGYKILMFISSLGILFAGYFSWGELPTLISNGFKAYFFGLPTCTLGFIFYLLVFLLSLVSSRKTFR